MKSIIKFILLLFFLTSCKDNGKKLIDRLVLIVDNGLKILEENRENPEIGVSKFRAYLKEQAPEISKLQKEADELKNKLSSKEKKELQKYFQKKMMNIDTRLESIAPIYKKSFEIIEEEN